MYAIWCLVIFLGMVANVLYPVHNAEVAINLSYYHISSHIGSRGLQGPKLSGPGMARSGPNESYLSPARTKIS